MIDIESLVGEEISLFLLGSFSIGFGATSMIDPSFIHSLTFLERLMYLTGAGYLFSVPLTFIMAIMSDRSFSEISVGDPEVSEVAIILGLAMVGIVTILALLVGANYYTELSNGFNASQGILLVGLLRSDLASSRFRK